MNQPDLTAILAAEHAAEVARSIRAERLGEAARRGSGCVNAGDVAAAWRRSLELTIAWVRGQPTRG
ncbi:MAG: hypothetical protein JO225_09405 [Candidatus Eremiobacteraeota bacterium]|nr:hypothetical protein [Candidatus Eremiobacteraeota bacterium]MBV8644117.1 hypothetical protein [Candidatus Eremiobacteraeota bacterium]